MTSLLLDIRHWDLTTDLDGNIALADDPYASAQDAACALKLFRGELIYDTAQGVPYFEQILGKAPPLSFLKSQLADAALTVPTVVTATVFISSFIGRTLTGQVLMTLASGQQVGVGLGSGINQASPFILGVSHLGGSDVL